MTSDQADNNGMGESFNEVSYTASHIYYLHV